MPNKKSKKRLRERKNQRAAKITKKQFIKSNDPNAPNCDINSEDDVMSVEYSDADIDELLLNEDLDECIIEDDYEPQPVLKEKRKFKGYDKNFIKRIDISRVNKDNYQKSLFHKNKEIFERFERIADQNRALNFYLYIIKYFKFWNYIIKFYSNFSRLHIYIV